MTQTLNRILFFVIAVGLCGSPDTGQAQDTAVTDQRFVVVQDDAEYRVQAKVMGKVKEGTIVQVDAINGDWLWVGSAKAYLPKASALPLREAIQYYGDRIAKEPDAGNFLQRAKLLRVVGEIDLALKDAESALKATPGHLETLLFQGSTLLTKKEHDAAIQSFNQAIKVVDAMKTPAYLGDVGLDGKSIMVNAKVLALNNRGWAQSEKGQHAAAISDFDRANLIEPNYARAILNRALTEERRGNQDVAIAGYGEVLRIVPNHSRTLNNRGRAHFAKGRYEEALKDFDESIKVDPTLGVAFDNRRSVWEKQKAWSKIFEDLESFAKGPKPAPALLNTLAWYLSTCPQASLRDGKRAHDLALKNCEQSDWKNPGMMDTLAAASAELGDYAKAAEYELKAIDLANDETKVDYEARLKLYQQQKPFRLE